MEAKPCHVEKVKLTKGSPLGEFLGIKMTGLKCEPHNQVWSSSNPKKPKYCNIGTTLRCAGLDRSKALGCTACGNSHAKTKEIYGEVA